MLKKNDILSSDFLDFEIIAPSEQKIDFSSTNQSNQFSTLVVYQPDAADEGLETFLSNILKAAKLDMSKDVFLLDTTLDSGFSFARLKTKVSIEKLIIFGLDPKNFGINLDLKLYVPISFQSCTFLLANKLSEIKSDVEKKRALWTCLQKIYLK